MKTVKAKKLALALVFASATAWGVSAVAEPSAEYGLERGQGLNSPNSPDAGFPESRSGNPGSPMPSNITPADRNITNPNIEGYSERSDLGQQPGMDQHSDVESQFSADQQQAPEDSNRYAGNPDGAVQFDPNSVTLTQQAARELDSVAKQLDKSRPVALIVEVEDLGVDASSSSSRAGPNQDSSSGYPGPDGVARGPAEQAASESHEDRPQLISMYRADSIREYLEKQGVDVVEWNLDSEATEEQGISISSLDERSSSGELGQDVQPVRIVVSGSIESEGLSTNADFE